MAALSRSESAVVTAGLSGQIEGRQAGRIVPAADEPSHQDELTSRLLKDQPAADIPAPEAKRSTPVMKGLETVQAALRSESGKPATSGGRIEVVAEQSFPAPPQNPMSQTASAVVDAIASDGLRQAFSTPSTTSQMASSVAVPTHVLKIELHPAELGVVTASMRLAGEQLSIELKPETHEAYRRLTSDSEAIVKSLRGLGFDVDKVTILQPSIAVPAATRADANSSLPMSSGRDQPSFQPGNSSGNNAGSGGQQPGRNPGNDAHEFGRPGFACSRTRWRRYVYLASLPVSRAPPPTRANRRSCAPPIATACLPASSMPSGLTETGNKGSLQPNALNIEGKAVFPRNRGEALATFENARREGKTLIDLGCMQINHHYHASHFRSVDDMLDPRQNVDYAARFLAALHARHVTWSMAVARYHAGPDNDPAQKIYVCRVIANMVATGFGKWTTNARNFCNP